MKVAIIGSRTINRVDFSKYLSFVPELIISGGANGVDKLAEEYAKSHNIAFELHKPDYARFGRGATFVRNREMVEAADCVYAFWDKVSRGTKYTIDYAQKLGKKVFVISDC